MKSKINIAQEIEKTMQSADRFERYEGKPFLLTRVNAALEKEQQVRLSFFEKLVLRPSLLGALLVLNIISAVYFFNSNSIGSNNSNQYIDQLADEFSISTNTYDIGILIREEQ